LLASAQGEDKQIHRYQVKVRPDHEFEDLATSFDSISRKLSQKLLMEKSFGRYVNPAILNKIMANPDEPWLKGTRTDATILFTDVRGFTGMFEKNQPEIIVEALNEYFEICARIIKKYEGYVDKFIGDAVLGVFGAPSPLDYHPLKAVNAALEIQKELKRRARVNTNPLLDKIGIGINTGVVVSGNIGSEEKMEYAVIGDSVNMASRISDLAAAGEIVVSSSVIEEIPPNLITVSELPPQNVKGKKDPITTYKVIKTTF
jgi:adenylate cyclase